VRGGAAAKVGRTAIVTSGLRPRWPASRSHTVFAQHTPAASLGIRTYTYSAAYDLLNCANDLN
jgi:hypothetical protein